MGRESKRTAGFGLVAISIGLLMATSSANAATLNVVGGQLLGASGVIVGGDSYNVEFLDGTCIALYSGCDALSHFTFQTRAAALLASQALLDQVFLDGGSGSFDLDPELTVGCVNISDCFALTPYGFVNTRFILYAPSRNNFDLADAAFAGNAQPMSADTATQSFAVYAVWSPVPEPGTALLMGLGLLGLGVRPRGQPRS